MKKVKIYESEIKRAVRRKLMENVLSENSSATDEMKDRTAAVKELTAAQKELAQVQKDMVDGISEEFEMKDTYSRKKYNQTPREGDIEGIFGQYSEEIPPSVLRYMRKNPEKIKINPEKIRINPEKSGQIRTNPDKIRIKFGL